MKRLILALAAVAAVASTTSVLAAGSVERGEYLVRDVMKCGNCHTPFGERGFDDSKFLSGRVVLSIPAFTAIAPNLTPSSEIAGWSDAELAKAIREGIRPDGTLIGPPMPFEVYHGISDDDLASVVAYLRTVPALENDPGKSAYNIPLPPAWGPPVETVAAVPEGITVEYGKYIAGPLAHCAACHTKASPDGKGPMFDTHLFAGGEEFGQADGSVVLSANLTPTGLSKYSDEELGKLIMTGERPDGTKLFPPMPQFRTIRPDDLAALILYLRSLPPLETP